ncbi:MULTISPECIES: hypothetical protein [unclassified Flavobacterium]|uniref:hypothetical protein n=1 Tax=unclassified Flavobacterium TaxID=196869 RepID=UPI001AD40FCF|nr:MULTISPECIES: hypothetical protein [unclassified Flavobacterium]MBN9285517.1 hypothetical protein [Flavobacterium sp.]
MKISQITIATCSLFLFSMCQKGEQKMTQSFQIETQQGEGTQSPEAFNSPVNLKSLLDDASAASLLAMYSLQKSNALTRGESATVMENSKETVNEKTESIILENLPPADTSWLQSLKASSRQ